MKKIMWFSRHDMNSEQMNDLQKLFVEIEVTKVNKTIQSVLELKTEIDNADILCIVMPLNLQAELIKLAGDKPILICRNHRLLKDDGTVEFVHAGWDKLIKIQIVKETLTNHVCPNSKELGKVRDFKFIR